MADTITIWNTALINVGVSTLVAATDEKSNPANILRVIYDLTRDEALEAAPWGFATRRTTLQSVGSPPQEWAYRYRYPGDCLTARRILSVAIRVFAEDQKVPFAIEEDEAQSAKVILCDSEQAVLEYTARITNPNLFPPSFTSVLAWGLAVKLAPALAAKPEFAVSAGQQYNAAIHRALARSFAEGHPGPMPDSEFIRARD